MKFIFILLCILCGILLLPIIREGFTNLDESFLISYTTFMKFYNEFNINYTKAILTSYGTSLPAGQPIGTPSIDQLNQYIPILSQKEGKPFPRIGDQMPAITTTDDFLRIQSRIPRDHVPFQNALEWMNSSLQTAHASLGSSLNSIQGFSDYDADYDTYEGFADICQQIQTCQAAQQQQTEQQMQQTQQELKSVFASFASLQPLLTKNNKLIATSQEIQDRAQSGDLLPKVAPRVSPYSLPPGSDKLQKMQKDDPEQYKKYEQQYGQFVGIKKYTDQVNSVLR